MASMVNRPLGPTWASIYAGERLGERLHAREKSSAKEEQDFLDLFINLMSAQAISDSDVLVFTLVNLLAGADTTAITLNAIFYYLVRNPDAYDQLCDEIRDAQLQEPVAYDQVKDLRYLNAVINEAMRLHPAVGALLERQVPEHGLELDAGEMLPSGTIVGMNPWVTGRDPAIFGSNAESFVPKRWLPDAGEEPAVFDERMRLFRNASLVFGAGRRQCLGRHLAMMEVRKLIPTLLKRYHLEPVEPTREWSVQCDFFMFPDKLDVTIRRRT